MYGTGGLGLPFAPPAATRPPPMAPTIPPKTANEKITPMMPTTSIGIATWVRPVRMRNAPTTAIPANAACTTIPAIIRARKPVCSKALKISPQDTLLPATRSTRTLKRVEHGPRGEEVARSPGPRTCLLSHLPHRVIRPRGVRRRGRHPCRRWHGPLRRGRRRTHGIPPARASRRPKYPYRREPMLQSAWLLPSAGP